MIYSFEYLTMKVAEEIEITTNCVGMKKRVKRAKPSSETQPAESNKENFEPSLTAEKIAYMQLGHSNMKPFLRLKVRGRKPLHMYTQTLPRVNNKGRVLNRYSSPL